MKILNFKNINQLIKYEFRYRRKKFLKENLNLVILFALSIALVYLFYVVLTVSSISKYKDINPYQIFEQLRQVYALLSILLVSMFVFINRNALQDKKTANYYLTSKLNYVDILYYSAIQSFKIYLCLILLFTVPNYIYFIMLKVSPLLFILEFICSLAIYTMNYLFVYTISMVGTVYIKNKWLRGISVIIEVLCYSILLHFVMSVQLVYVSICIFILLGFNVCNELIKKAGHRYFYKKVTVGLTTPAKQKKEIRFSERRYLRYVQFDIKRLINTGDFTEYIFLMLSLIGCWGMSIVLVPKYLMTFVQRLIVLMGIKELQIILPISLALFILSNYRLLENSFFDCRIIKLSTTVFYFLINNIVLIAFSIIMYQSFNGIVVRSFELLAFSELSFVVALFLGKYFNKKTGILCICILLANVLQYLVEYCTKGNTIMIIAFYFLVFVICLILSCRNLNTREQYVD